MSITLIIILFTTVTSYIGFSNNQLVNDFIFHPVSVKEKNQWYRFITCGFIHADLVHLAFNMISLYMFGEEVEKAFAAIFGTKGKLLYLLLYISALIVCLLPTYFKEIDNYYYRSLGASGAVSAIVFTGIFLFPTAKIGIFIIPPFIPGFIFAPIYLYASAVMAKKGQDNINHSAHIWGSIYGIVFFIAACFLFSSFNPINNFMGNIVYWLKSF